MVASWVFKVVRRRPTAELCVFILPLQERSRTQPVGSCDHIKLVRGSIGWSACQGFGGGLGPQTWGGSLHGDTFEWRRCYEGQWEAVKTHKKTICWLLLLNISSILPFSLQLSHRHKTFLLWRTWINCVSCSLPLSLSFSPYPPSMTRSVSL